MDRDSRIAELEREVAELRDALAARPAAERPHGDATVARLLSDKGLLSSLPDVITILDREHRIVYLNRVVPGRTVAELLGQSVLDYLEEGEREERRAALEHVWATGETRSLESRSVGGYVWDNRLVPIVENGQIAYVLTTSVDVTERRRAEHALRESESRLRHALAATGMGTWSSSRHTREVTCDDALCRIYGLDRTSAPTTLDEFLKFIHPDDRAYFATAMEAFRKKGSYEDLAFRIVRPDGSVRHLLSTGSVALDASGTSIGSYGGVLDVTNRKLLEEQLHQVQKMEAIGQLTAGIAHNFNNVLAVILPNVELCRAGASTADAVRLDDVAHAAERAAEMVRQLMLFARRETTARREPIDLAASARRTADICRTTFDRKIEFELSVDPDLPSALANAGQIEQVLLNVCLNARDALEEARPAEPRIEVRVERARAGVIRIRVSDNGVGMDEATRSRIFEPFFTTKDVHRGTGLGLASAYAIITDHRGKITCESRPCEGATFEIELPATEQGPARRQDADARPRPSAETVLLIDDEPLVRGAVRGLLELGGYRVLEAGNGMEGIATFEREGPHVSAVLVDRLMPGLSGEQVLFRLGEIDPDVPVVLLSGHPGHAHAVSRAAAVLAKPTSADTLLRTLRQVIERSATARR